MGWSGLISRMRLLAVTFWRAILRMRSMLAPRSSSPETSTAGLSLRRVVTRTSLRMSPILASKSFMKSLYLPSASLRPFLLLLGEIAQVQVALGDVHQLLAVELGEALHHPFVDGVGEVEHLDVLGLEHLQVRAAVHGGPALAGDVIDVLLPVLHAGDVFLQSHVMAFLGLAGLEAHQALQLVQVLPVHVEALLHHRAELLPEGAVLLRRPPWPWTRAAAGPSWWRSC